MVGPSAGGASDGGVGVGASGPSGGAGTGASGAGAGASDAGGLTGALESPAKLLTCLFISLCASAALIWLSLPGVGPLIGFVSSAGAVDPLSGGVVGVFESVGGIFCSLSLLLVALSSAQPQAVTAK